MKKLVLLIALSISFVSNAQTIWQTSNEAQLQKIEDSQKPIQPTTFDLFEVDAQALSDKLVNAVDRFSGGAAINVDFPVGNDQFETFSIFTSGAVSDELHAQYPNIQSYMGQSKTNLLNKIYFTITPKGFHGLITGEEILYMDPYSKVSPESIMIYNRKNLKRPSDDNFECHTIDELDSQMMQDFESSMTTKAFRDRTFRTYRIAVAATGEYTAYHDDGNNANGNAVADALAGIVVTITRVNSVYEQEMSMRFSLIGNNSNVIYTNSNTDPYSNYSGSAMLNQNVNNLNSVIGSGNFDIGHVFSTGGGGIAGTSPCGSGKARGVTGIVTPEFDPFDIDYVCHEIGHQFGASHTFYNGCFGGSPSSAPYETGSASTIMGYAGICAPNVQDNSDAYFHHYSLIQMQSSIDGDTCETELSLGALNPTAPFAVSPGMRTIPISTPFKLTSSSSTPPDAGEVYTYNWEEFENGSASATGRPQPPVSTNNAGPLFRSKFPTTSPTRYFPNLPDLVNNIDPVWEELPGVARQLRFRCSIRDNNPNGGQTHYAQTTLTVGSAGPFLMNSPNGGEIWHEGENRTITWSVNGTNNSTYSTTVNILLSLDGGYTYPVVLLSNTNNDGSQVVTIPAGVKTSQARIMVEAANNYFFDITNNNFEIKEGTFELTSVTDDFSVCQPNDGTTTFQYNAAPNFNETVTFNATGLPAGLTASFSPASTTTDATVDVTISGTSGVSADQYDFTVEAQSSSATITKDFSFKLFDDTIGDVVNISPINGAGNQIANPLLEWEDLTSASTYLVEISESPDFSSLTESNTVSFVNTYQPSNLVASKIYYWRVTPSNDCIAGEVVSISSFQTAQDVCNTYGSEAVYAMDGTTVITPGDTQYTNDAQPSGQLNQKRWNTSVNAVAASIMVTDDIEVTNLSFYMNATHGDTGHIKMQLSAPTGRFSEVYNRECAAGVNFDLIVSDQGTQNFGCNPGYTGPLTGNQRPGQAFSRFNGLSGQGEWVLLATDRTSGTGGTFNEFTVTVCGRLQYVNDLDNNRNNLLTTAYGATSIINQSLLRTQQTGTSNANVNYVITKLPSQGNIELNGTPLVLGATFTQADLNNDRIQYVHNSIELTYTDGFDYIVEGASNTLMNAQSFNIEIQEPTLIYDFGWTPFAPSEDTGSLNAQVINGLATITGNAQINNFDIVGSANSFLLEDQLTIYGNLDAEGYLAAIQGELLFAGTSPQIVSGDGFIDVEQLTLSNANGVTFNTMVNIMGILTPNNSTINSNGNLIFKSDATGTAQLDDASNASINGEVTVERFIPGKRAYRFVASSVNSTGTIYENWQENGAPTAGLGTHISGSTTGANGFDTTISGAPSLYGFDNNNQTWTAPANTNATNLNVGTPYRLFVRGDRTIDLTTNSAPATDTKLRAVGAIHKGDQTQSASTSTGEFVMIANPYQAIVDFKTTINDASTTGVNSNFAYYWDPNLNTRGGYATIDMTTLNGDPVPSSSNANKYLQPGQSLFVQASGAASITFKETHKSVDTDLNNIFNQPQLNSSIIISLHERHTQVLMDQTVLRFNASNNPQLDASDALKFYNQDETLATVINGNSLSINKTITPSTGDSILLLTDRYRNTAYQFNININGVLGTQAVLMDHFNGQRTILNTGMNTVDFDVIAGDTASSGVNRFEIIFENQTLSSGDLSLQDDLALFPNPVTSGQFTIQSSLLNGQETTVSVFNALGQLIHSQTATFNNTLVVKPQVNMSSGVYIAKISTQDQNAALQFIVK